MEGKTSDTIYFLTACFFSLIVRTIEIVAFKATHHAISIPSFSKKCGMAASAGIFNRVPETLTLD